MKPISPFRAVEGWEKLPPGYTHKDVDGAAVDSEDNVYLMTRQQARVIVYDRNGNFLRSWGEGLFTERTHGIAVGPDGMVYCVDDGDHSVRKFTPEGRELMVIGTPGRPSDTGYNGKDLTSIARGGAPFNRPTDAAVEEGGGIYVSDGYGNARVHRFAADGKLLRSWGEPGTGPGQFMLPHGIGISPDRRLFVADRENDRIQIFRTDGSYLGEWEDVQRPCSIALTGRGDVVVAELWRPADNRSFVTDTTGVDQPGRISLLSPSGELLNRWGASADDKAAEGNVIAPHSVAVDSADSVYVGEVTYTYGIKPGRVPEDHASHQIQKFTASRAEDRAADRAEG